MKRMSKKAVAFAIKHQISLGQWGSGCSMKGHYHIVDHENGCTVFNGQRISAVSLKPNTKSAIFMMRRHLRERGLK